MRLLLDTHSILWYAFGDPRLSSKARALIDDAANDKFLSIVSPWEVGIKVSSGKLTVEEPVDVFFADQMRLLSLQLLPITLEHAAPVSTLPLYHRDPFDRMLVAQSLAEGMPIISADPALDAYAVVRFW